jgi:hypothetical protein
MRGAAVARLALVAMLLGAQAALLPLAQASPPDQTWLGGFYDDADYDDVVLLVTSLAGALPMLPPVTAAFLVVVAPPPRGDAETAALCDPLRISSRAPPAA